MRDPLEGLTADGFIRTGASRHRIPAFFTEVLDAAASRIRDHDPNVAVYLYGSVATGVARPASSDVDLLTIGLPAHRGAAIGNEISADFAAVCRGVEIATAMSTDFDGDHDSAYGVRVFVRHYCVHLAGPDETSLPTMVAPSYPGDRRAARGFNGDIGRHAERWRSGLDDADPTLLARRVARKTLLAVAGLVSVHDDTWTTDRELAARRWQEIHPELAAGLNELLDWSEAGGSVTALELDRSLRTTVDRVVWHFENSVGLWTA